MGIVQNAQAYSERVRKRRAEFLRTLPNAVNPRRKIRIPEPDERAAPVKKTRRALIRQAQAIRESIGNQRLARVGKSRKGELVIQLEFGAQYAQLQKNMNREQQHEFQVLSEIIARGSAQSVAILFEYSGGQSLYTGAFDLILQSTPDVEGGLGLLAELAEAAQRAATLYAPSKIGRLSF
jgi:hypothetical protein